MDSVLKTKEEVFSIFEDHDEVLVVFEKMDGSIRHLKCTLSENTIPKDNVIQQQGGVMKNPDIPGPFVVWDTENDGSSQRTANARGGININQDGNVVNSASSIKVKVYQGSTGSADGGEVDQSANYFASVGDLA